MGGAPPASPPGPDSSLRDEFSKAALAPFSIPSWSDLPTDILISILQRLELPQAFAFASVCTTWRAAATTAGVPRSWAPWIMSWGNHLNETGVHGRCSSVVTCNLYHPVDVNKSYGVSFPKGSFVFCCGASHGWLILVNDLSNLVLYNPVTLAMIPLPPVTEFTCVEVACGGYSVEGHFFEAIRFGRWFYQKAVLSCSPSKGGVYVVMLIHHDSAWLSFVKAGQGKWQVVSTLRRGERYLDCAYHKGRFYSVTFDGMVEKWNLDGANGPTRDVVVVATPHSGCILRRHLVSTDGPRMDAEVVGRPFPGCILSRHLVSTPWGDLLQVRSVLAVSYPDGIAFQIYKVVPDGCKKVQENVLEDHALFLGLNHSACLPTQNLPGIRRHCIYFSAPVLTHAFDFLLRVRAWGGAKTYDLERGRFECVVPCDVDKLVYGVLPSEVWITQNL